jgi:hypothetical protein
MKRMRGCGRVLVTLAMTLVLSKIQTRVEAQGRSIEGVWGMSITIRDCATSAPVGPPFRSILTFHQGGTISESPANPGLVPGQRSPGHGVWTETGPATYSSKFLALILFDTPPNPPLSPGFLAGWQVGTQTATLTGADTLTTTGQVQFYDLNRQLYRTICAGASGERFK